MKKTLATLALFALAGTSFAHNHMSGDATTATESKSHHYHHKMQEHRAKYDAMSFEDKKAWAQKHLQRMADYVHKQQACVEAATNADELSACKGKRHHH